jgi:hypothetical protein
MIKKLFILCFFLVFAASCETYKDYEIQYTPIYPLSGEWIVKFTDTSVTPNVTDKITVLSTYNTSDNSTTQMWIRDVTSTSANGAEPYYVIPVTGKFCGKINCSVTGKSFSGENVINTQVTAAPVPTFTITEGIIETDGFDTATGGKSDKITFKMTDSRKPGKVYEVSGFRRTRWLADEI